MRTSSSCSLRKQEPPRLQASTLCIKSRPGPLIKAWCCATGDAAVSEDVVAELANDCFYRYKSALQREDIPELTITLPPGQDGPPVPALANGAATEANANGSKAGEGQVRRVSVRVDYSGRQEAGCSLRFRDGFACSDNQVCACVLI